MSVTYIPTFLRREVEKRAKGKCEYCQLPAGVGFFPHEIDHIIAEKHGGKTEVDNLAYTCWRCNRHKGTDLGSFDPETGEFSFFFNPRTQIWSAHFLVEGIMLKGLTSEGRTTIKILQFNTNERLAERECLLM